MALYFKERKRFACFVAVYFYDFHHIILFH